MRPIWLERSFIYLMRKQNQEKKIALSKTPDRFKVKKTKKKQKQTLSCIWNFKIIKMTADHHCYSSNAFDIEPRILKFISYF